MNRMHLKNNLISFFSNTIVQYTGVATSCSSATVKGLEEHWSPPFLNHSEKQVSESFYPAEGRVSPLTILKLLMSGPLTSSALVSILTVWMGDDAVPLQIDM